MMPAQTEISQLNVRVWWTDEAEIDSGGIPLNAYGIIIRSWAGEFLPVAQCNGTNSTLVSARECFVPLSVLTSQPFLLSQGNLVAVKI